MCRFRKEGNQMSYEKMIDQVRESSPLVHNMTNQVVANDVANSLIALGASPIMAYAPEEVAEVASISKAVVLNIGTLTKEQIDSMIIAGKAANKNNVPVILDPVGVGATTFRKEMVDRLFSEITFTVIRGNVAEIASLAEVNWQAKGVDAGEGSGSKEDIAKTLAQKKQCVVAISGEKDILSDGETVATISNGHKLMGQITGSGCMLSGVCGAFIGANQEDTFHSLIAAHVTYTIAGEMAANRADVKGPGTFRQAFMDELLDITPEDITKNVKVEVN